MCSDPPGFVEQTCKSRFPRSTMVLYSHQTHTPLASIIFKPTAPARESGCISMLVERPPPPGSSKERYIQGLLNLPNQEFEFILTNLTGWGIVKLSIIHHRRWIPGGRVNYCSLLRSNQTDRVDADFTNGNRKMVLGTKSEQERVDTTAPPQQQKESLTVEQAEAAAGNGNKGVYFDVVVSPDQTCPELRALFSEGRAIWEVKSTFTRRVPPKELRDRSVLKWKVPKIFLGNSRRSTRTTNPAIGAATRSMRNHKAEEELTFKKVGGEGCNVHNYDDRSFDVGSTITGTLKHNQHIPNTDVSFMPKFIFQVPRHRAFPTVLCLSVCPEMEPPPARAKLLRKKPAQAELLKKEGRRSNEAKELTILSDLVFLH